MENKDVFLRCFETQLNCMMNCDEKFEKICQENSKINPHNKNHSNQVYIHVEIKEGR